MRFCDRHIHGAIALAFALGLAGAAAPAAALTLTVGVYPQKPDISIASDGRLSGILGTLLEEIARQEDWALKVHPCSWSECMTMLQNGQIDLLPDVHYTVERSKRFSFHHIPAVHSWSQVYARTDHTLRSIQDLDKHSIALLSGSSQADYLQNTFKALGVNVKTHLVAQLEDGFKLVQALQNDAVAADYFYGGLTAQKYGLAATPIIFNPTQSFYATPLGKHPEVLAAIDRHLGAWQANADSFYYRTLEHWRKPDATPAITDNTYWIIAGLSAILALVLVFALLFRVQIGRQRQRLLSSELRLDAILDSIDAIVSIKGPDRRIVFANRKLENFLGAGPDGLLGYRDEDFLTDPESIRAVQQSDQEVLQSQTRVVNQYPIKKPGHEEACIFIAFKARLTGPQGQLEGICTVATDITERVRAEETAHRLTFYDALTNLPNRRMMLDRLSQLLDNAQQGNTIAALLVINLDGFKKVNDMYGHQMGDLVLCGIAQRLVTTTRERDLASRISADEFIVLLNGLGKQMGDAARKAMHVAEKLRMAIGNHAVTAHDKPAYVTASIGLTLIHKSSQNIDNIMREADLASHRAKHQGGNQVTFYEQDLQSEVEQSLWLEHDLLQALNTPQLSMHIQPQFGPGGRVIGGELLARWQHPSRGEIAPAQFIPIAETTGLIALLGEWSLKVACETLISLQSLGETYPLSLNISPKRLMDPQFAEYVQTMLERTGVPGNRLIFEITEGVLIQDIQAVALRMQTLARMGIRFSIDDFGTGYSNLVYLKRLPLYELKIDKSLIQDIPGDANNLAIIQLILAMADQLNLQVVAEGVETQDQSDFLYKNHCHAQQGFLLARPMPITTWLDAVQERRQKSPDALA